MNNIPTGYQILIYIGIALLVLVTWIKFHKHSFSYHDRFRRYCNECGQEQRMFVKANEEQMYWRDHGRIPNPDCHCHDYDGELV